MFEQIKPVTNKFSWMKIPQTKQAARNSFPMFDLLSTEAKPVRYFRDPSNHLYTGEISVQKESDKNGKKKNKISVLTENLVSI